MRPVRRWFTSSPIDLRPRHDVVPAVGVCGMSAKQRRGRSVALHSMQQADPWNQGKPAVTPTNERKSGDRYIAFMVIAAAITACILLMLGLAQLASGRAPETGDIIAFPGTRTPLISATSFTARRAITTSGMSCTLDVQTMQRSGGSLVVEASEFSPSRIFRVHWAGVRTSSNHDDCGSSADLLLNNNQIFALIFAAGGKGVKAQD